MIIRKLSLLILVALSAVACTSTKLAVANTRHRISQFTHTGKLVLHNAFSGGIRLNMVAFVHIASPTALLEKQVCRTMFCMACQIRKA